MGVRAEGAKRRGKGEGAIATPPKILEYHAHYSGHKFPTIWTERIT